MQPRRKVRHQRAARQTLIGLAVGMLTFNVALIVACEFMPRLRDPLFGDKYHKLSRVWDSQSPLVMMLGTSRTGYGFHAQHIEARMRPVVGPMAAFNFGIPASGPVTHALYLRRLLDAGVRPKLLLVEVLPSMLADHGQQSPLEGNWFRPDRIRDEELDLVERYGLSRQQFAAHLREFYIRPWYTLRFQLLARLSGGWVPWGVRYDWGRGGDAHGWITQVDQRVTPESYTKGLRQARAEYATILADLKIGGPAVDALHDILTLCRDANVPVKLVWMPEGDDFRQMYPPHVQERITQFLHQLPQQYPVEIVDARTWVPNDAFSDAHHLLRIGAEQFSTELVNRVILPHWQGAP